MLDRHIVPRIKAPLRALAERLNASGWTADQVTWGALGSGC